MSERMPKIDSQSVAGYFAGSGTSDTDPNRLEIVDTSWCMLAQVVPSCHTMLQVPVWIGSGSGTSAIDPNRLEIVDTSWCRLAQVVAKLSDVATGSCVDRFRFWYFC